MDSNAKATKASEDRFCLLHDLTTELIIKRIENGEECSSQDIKLAIDWLAKNNITGVATADNGLGKLRHLVPVVDPEHIRRTVNGA